MSVKAHIAVFPKESDSIVYVPAWKVVRYTHAQLDAANKLAIPVPAGTHVLAVAHLTKTAFNNSADLNIGDPADDDGYIPAASVNPGAANDFACSLGSAAAYAGGRYYATGGRIVLSFTADPSAGAGEVRILMSGLEEYNAVA